MGRKVGAGDIERHGPVGPTVLLQHIFWQGDHHRPLATGLGGDQGAVDKFHSAVGMGDFQRQLGDASVHLAVVDFLERPPAAMAGGDLPNE